MSAYDTLTPIREIQPKTDPQGGVCLETTFDYLRQFGPILAERILETYPPLQSTKDPVAPGLAGLLRKPLPAQAVAITGTAKYLRKAKAARIVAECGAGKTLMSLGTIHVLSEGQPTTTLVMCPSHITHKWAGNSVDCVARQDLFDRGHAQRRRSQEAARNLRSQTAQGQNRVRGNAAVAYRFAAHGRQRVAQALLRSCFLHYRQR